MYALQWSVLPTEGPLNGWIHTSHGGRDWVHAGCTTAVQEMSNYLREELPHFVGQNQFHGRAVRLQTVVPVYLVIIGLLYPNLRT